MTRREERAEFMMILGSEFHNRPHGEVMELARLLMRHAGSMQRIAERLCTEEMSPREQERVEKRDSALERRIEELCAPYGIVPVFQGDPRGAVVKLKVPSGRTNDWGQIGICVPSGN